MRARLHAAEKLRRGVQETRIHDHFAEAKVAERHHPVALAVRRAVSNRPVHVLLACADQASGLVAGQQQQACHSDTTQRTRGAAEMLMDRPVALPALFAAQLALLAPRAHDDASTRATGPSKDGVAVRTAVERRVAALGAAQVDRGIGAGRGDAGVHPGSSFAG